MANTLTINYNGKSYKAEFDRATAKAYAMTGNRVQDVWENPFVAITLFIHCAFKKHQPTITEKKSTEIYDALPANKITSFISWLSNVKAAFSTLKGVMGTGASKGLFGVVGGLTAGAASGVLLYSSLKNLIKGTGNLKNNIAKLAGGITVAGVAIAGFVAMGNPIGAIVTGVVALGGAIWGVISAGEELNRELGDLIFYADNGGISVSDFSDCFVGLFDTVSGRYQDIITTSEAIRDNREKAQTAADEIFNLTDKYQKLGEAMTPEDAQKIKENLDIIGSAIKDNLGNYTKTLVDNLKNSFHELAVRMGLDVDDMVGKWYLLENMGNSALANMRKDADELSAKIISGDATDEDYTRFNETVAKMATVNTHTSEQEAMNRAFANVTNGSIDFESADAVTGAINDLKSAYETAQSTVTTARDAQAADLANYKDTLKSWGVDVEYDEKYGKGAFDKLFSDQKTLIEEGYKEELNKLDTMYYSAIGAIWSQADQKVLDVFNAQSPGFLDYFSANWNAPASAVFSADYWNGSYGSMKANEEKNADKENRMAELKSGQFRDIYDVLGAAGLDASNNEQYFKEIGGYIVQGVANGVITGSDTLENAMNVLATSGVDAFKELLQIHSPSKVFEELGEYVTQGLVNGISDGEADVDTAIENVAAAMASNSVWNNVKPGFAWEGAREMSSNSDQSNLTVTTGDTYITVELDGEEVLGASQRVQGRQIIMSNGR